MKKVWMIEIKLPTGILLWFYSSKNEQFCLAYKRQDATHFPTKLAAEEYLLNIKYLNPTLEAIQGMYSVEYMCRECAET